MYVDNEMRDVLQNIVDRANAALNTLDSRGRGNKYDAVARQMDLIDGYVDEMYDLLNAADSNSGSSTRESSSHSTGKWCKSGSVNSINEALTIPVIKKKSPWSR